MLVNTTAKTTRIHCQQAKLTVQHNTTRQNGDENSNKQILATEKPTQLQLLCIPSRPKKLTPLY